MKRSRLLGPFAAALVALPLVAGCSSDSSPTVVSASSAPASSSSSSAAPAQRTSACKHVPTQSGNADWLPTDLPLPPGTYAIEDTDSPTTTSDADANVSDAPAGAQRGLFVVKMTVADFKHFVATNWPPAGYALGRGDAEAGEAEGGYRKGDFGGVYRVRDVYCDPTMSELLLTYGKGA